MWMVTGPRGERGTVSGGPAVQAAWGAVSQPLPQTCRSRHLTWAFGATAVSEVPFVPLKVDSLSSIARLTSFGGTPVQSSTELSRAASEAAGPSGPASWGCPIPCGLLCRCLGGRPWLALGSRLAWTCCDLQWSWALTVPRCLALASSNPWCSSLLARQLPGAYPEDRVVLIPKRGLG